MTMLDGTSAHRDVSIRATPSLVSVFVIVMLVQAPDLHENLLVCWLLVTVMIVLTWCLGNVLRRRPAWARIQRIGWFERAAFVLVPSIVTMVLPASHTVDLDPMPDRMLAALLSAATMAGMLAVILLVAELGLIALSVWVGRELLGSLARSAPAVTRSLPVLLALVTFGFFTAELWQSIGRLDTWAFAGSLALFVATSAAFLARPDHLDVDALATFADADALTEALRNTPAGDHIATHASGIPDTHVSPRRSGATTCATAGDNRDAARHCPLSRRQRINLVLVATLSRLVGASVLGLTVFGFFTAFSAFVVNAELVKSWAQADADVLLSWATSRRSYALTWEQLRVAGFLGVFSGFYFTVVSTTDATLRQGLSDTAQVTVRQACALRLWLISAAAGSGPVGVGRDATAPPPPPPPAPAALPELSDGLE
jgi:hypothetical protein